MINKEKCVEYYFDSEKYDESQVIENMKKEQLGFEKKKSEITVTLNEYGTYVAQLRFLNNELSIIRKKMAMKVINKRQIKSKPKIRKTYKGYETYNGNNRIYGEYKATRTYNANLE